MLIRKLMIAGLVLVTFGWMLIVSRSVIGQQPSTGATNDNDAGQGVPATRATNQSADPFAGESDTPATVSDDAAPAADNRAAGGTSSAGKGIDNAAPPAGSGPALGTAPGKNKGRGTSSGKTPRNNSAAPATPSGMGMPGRGTSSSMRSADNEMRGQPAEMMGSMPGMGSASMSASVPEDEHLETWVSQALADYSRTEDQNARQKRRDEIAKALDRIFVIRQERRMQELETLEQRVQKLRGTLETREKLKSEILKDRLDYLVREADGLGWGDGVPAPGRSAPTGFGSSGTSSSSNNFQNSLAPGQGSARSGPAPR